jgi:hypothetical protein
LSRKAGWRIPPNTLKVSRGTTLGNPFRIYEHCKGPDGDWGVEDTGRFCQPVMHGWQKAGAVRFAIECYQQQLDLAYPKGSSARWILARNLAESDYLACWCPLDQPCHADVLIELAKEAEGA